MSRFIVDTELDEIYELHYKESGYTGEEVKNFGSITALRRFVDDHRSYIVKEVVRVTKLDNWREM